MEQDTQANMPTEKSTVAHENPILGDGNRAELSKNLVNGEVFHGDSGHDQNGELSNVRTGPVNGVGKDEQPETRIGATESGELDAPSTPLNGSDGIIPNTETQAATTKIETEAKSESELNDVVHLEEDDSISDTPICHVCKSSGKTQVASNYCVTCGSLLCSECTHVHKGHSPDTEHVLIDVTQGRLASVQCKQHGGELIRVFCLTCNTPACKMCLTEQHFQHKMSDFTARRSPDSALVKSIGWQIQNQLKELRGLKLDLTDAVDATEKNRRDVNGAIIEHMNAYITFLQEKKQELVDNSDEFHRAVQGSVSRQLNVVEKAMSVMTNLQTRVDTGVYPLPPHGHVAPEIFPLHVIQRLFTQIALPEVLPTDFGTRDCSFATGEPIKPGTLHTGQPTVKRILTQFNDAEIGKRKVRVLWNKAVEAYDVHFLPNKSNDIICTDINKGYKLIKMRCDGKLSPLPVSLSGFAGRECSLGVNRWTGQKVIVYKPEPNDRNIVLTTLSGDDDQNLDVTIGGAKLPPGNTIISGVTLTHRGNVVVMATDDAENPTRTSVNCFTSAGDPLWHRNTSPSSLAGDLQNPAFIAVDQLDRVVISDSSGGKVNIYTSDGSHLQSFPARDPEYTGLKPTGVCADSRGRILVAFHDLRAVALFTANGGFIRHLVQLEGAPWGMSLSQDRYLSIALENMGLWFYDLKDLD